MQITELPLKKRNVSRRKVAAYARVSIDSDTLLHSLANQVSYYSDLISSNPEWEFVGIYVDEGISGTNMDNRVDFMRMMKDARQGKIDLIISKSVSRFARNTVELLQSIRDLQRLNVEVLFEKDGISTFDGTGELMLSLLASFAQAEAESLSENVKWGKRKQMQEGVYHHYSRCYGYEWQGDDYVIVPKEAKVVRFIFKSYIAGLSPKHIAEEIDVPTTTGAPFSRQAVKDILKNRIYVGDRVLQKYYAPKLRKKSKNYGELPQYVLEGVHEGIITHSTFDQVQRIMKQRAEKAPKKTFTCFTGKIKCGYCGRSCCRRTLHGKHIWRCQGKEISKTCNAMHIREDELRSITFSIFADEEDFIRKINRVDLYDDHIVFVTTDEKTIKRERIERRHQKNARK